MLVRVFAFSLVMGGLACAFVFSRAPNHVYMFGIILGIVAGLVDGRVFGRVVGPGFSRAFGRVCFLNLPFCL